LRVQSEVGGMFNEWINKGVIPIANKYREVKLKRTLERESKEPETLYRKGLLVRPNALSVMTRCDTGGLAWFC
jgi:hypothetical protein